jgi:hypothetical protein
MTFLQFIARREILMSGRRRTINPNHSRAAKKRLKSNSAIRRGGHFVGKDGLTKLERWSLHGFVGFNHWYQDCSPHVQMSDRSWEPIKFTRDQKDFLKSTFLVDDRGRWKYDTILNIGPRRLSKTYMAALIVLFLTCSRSNHITQLSGNTEEHSRRVQLRLLKNIILHTPELRKIFNPVEKNLMQSEIRHPKNGSFVQMNTQSTSMAFGQGFSVLWHSDLHALIDDSAFNAMQSGLLDTFDALLLIDSNVDHLGGRVHKFELQAAEDESIFCHRVKYESWEEFLRLAPRWISRKRAERIKKTVLEAEWKRDLLGLRSSVVNSLFPRDVVALCRDSYRCPVEDIKSLVGERSFVIGGGLDRADSEWGSIFGNDNSVFTVTCKVADPKNQEPQLYVIDQHVFRPSTGRAIKKHIIKMHRKYGFKNVTLEAHNVTDIQPYLVEQGVPCETVNPHSTTQNIAWPELVRIAKTGRLRISEDLPKLFREMSGMTYTKLATGNYRFGADSQAAKDDRCFSLLWAVYSLRNEVLQAYTLGNVLCLNKSPKRHLCYIFGGSLEMCCGQHCQAHQEVKEFYRQFMQYQTESTLTLPVFFYAYVTVKGARISQAA